MHKNVRQTYFSKENLPMVLLGVLLLILAVKAVAIRFSAELSGDEYFYLREVLRFRDIGFTAALQEGISILFVIPGHLLAYLTGDILMANRILSLLSLGVILHALIRMAGLMHISKNLQWLMSLTILAFAFDYQRSPFLFGTNDTFLYALLAESFYFLIRFLQTDERKNLLVSGVFLGLGFWVREITSMYLAAVALAAGVYSIHQLRKRNWSGIAWVFIFFGVTFGTGVIPHLPALISSGHLAFEDKNYMGNWRERDYLSQIRRLPSGSVFAYTRVEWDEVEQYKREGHLPELPKTRYESFKLDPKMAADSFASNLLIRCTYLFSLRNGVLFLLFLASFWLWDRMKSNNLTKPWLFLSMVIISYALMISAITLHRIEIRWLTLVILLMTLTGSMILDMLKTGHPKLFRNLVYVQYCFIGLSILRLIL